MREAAFGGCRESEREIAEPLFARLGPGDLVLIDIGFYSGVAV